ncbi:MAG: hypothetical protein IJO63_05015 [Bacilli bacterium]|nr:hypothetical protein [Bacilli bacterium]
MFEIPENILEYFFLELKKKGKYNTVFLGNSAIIEARKEQSYYKPNIVVKDVADLEVALIEFVNELNTFYSDKPKLEDYHDLSFFFNNLLINMTSTDAEDLTSFIYKRIAFFRNNQFEEFDSPKLLMEKDGVKYYAQRFLECPGLETPYVMVFYMESDGIRYNLPLIRYAFDEDGVCYLFAVQFGRDRIVVLDDTYRDIVNDVNQGITKFRNVSPSFVVSLSLFVDMLRELGTTKMVAPDFLFGRYRKYIGASSVTKSNQILERILDNFVRLLKRMEFQDDGFVIEFFPLDVDSYTHITILPKEKEKILKRES